MGLRFVQATPLTRQHNVSEDVRETDEYREMWYILADGRNKVLSNVDFLV